MTPEELARVFGSAWCSPAEAAAWVPDGATLATGLIEPSTLLEALASRECGGRAVIAAILQELGTYAGLREAEPGE